MANIVVCVTCEGNFYTMQTRKQEDGRYKCTGCLGITPGSNSPKTKGKTFTKRK